MKGSTDASDYFIIVFIAVVFITGAVAVYKFMNAGKKK
jgi:nitrate reductase gamma subunit